MRCSFPSLIVVTLVLLLPSSESFSIVSVSRTVKTPSVRLPSFVLQPSTLSSGATTHQQQPPRCICTAVRATKQPQSSIDTNNGNKNEQQEQLEDRISFVLLFVMTPLLSFTLPILLSLNMYEPLSIAKRLVIYAMAITIVGVGSYRGSRDDASLGKRLESLTGEIIPRRSPFGPDAQEKDDDDGDERFRDLRVLDQVDTKTQSAVLPIIVASSLALSVLFLQFENGVLDLGASGGSDFGSDDALILEIKKLISELSLRFSRDVFPLLVQCSNAATVGLFTRAELSRGVTAWSNDDNDDNNDDEGNDSSSGIALDASIPLTLALLSAAYLLPPSIAWPARNAVCMCLGVAVSRAAQLPKLGPVIGALSVLVLYDVYSVGMQLVNLGGAALAAKGGAAAAAATAASTTGGAGNSAMGAVAMAKVDGTSSSLWQPGLLEVRLGGRISDLLGLGDAVFPSLLATFALRYDREKDSVASSSSSSSSSSQEESGFPFYFATSLLGFMLGCAACEIVPGIDSSGLPALLLIVPSMLTTVLGLAVVRGDLSSMWNFDPAKETQDGDLTL